MNKHVIKDAFIKSLPIMCSYLFVGMAYGIMMQEAGFDWYYTVGISITVYTGAFQFLLITFLSGGASFLTIGVTALLMNSRQTFYSITFLDEFKKMGKKKLYMIFTMSDETYAVNCMMDKNDKDKHSKMFFVAIFARFYWIFAGFIGAMLGQIIPVELKGIDFCMTALFVIILVDQWEKQASHLPTIVAAIVGTICLLIFGKQTFILPSLLIVSGILLLFQKDSKCEKLRTPDLEENVSGEVRK